MAKTKTYTFIVAGGTRTRFPLDMLRYDGCYPADPSSVDNIDWSLDPERKLDGYIHKVKLISTVAPTVARWASFGWTVIEIED